MCATACDSPACGNGQLGTRIQAPASRALRAPVSSTRLDSSRRAARIRRVIEECLRARASGRVLTDAQIIEAHPELLPELRQELGLLGLMQRAASTALAD